MTFKQPYIETYNEKGFRLARIEPLITSTEWTLFTLPPDSNTEVSMIVLSEGLEVDNLRMSMKFPVQNQYIRVQSEKVAADSVEKS